MASTVTQEQTDPNFTNPSLKGAGSILTPLQVGLDTMTQGAQETQLAGEKSLDQLPTSVPLVQLDAKDYKLLQGLRARRKPSLTELVRDYGIKNDAPSTENQASSTPLITSETALSAGFVPLSPELLDPTSFTIQENNHTIGPKTERFNQFTQIDASLLDPTNFGLSQSPTVQESVSASNIADQPAPDLNSFYLPTNSNLNTSTEVQSTKTEPVAEISAQQIETVKLQNVGRLESVRAADPSVGKLLTPKDKNTLDETVLNDQKVKGNEPDQNIVTSELQIKRSPWFLGFFDRSSSRGVIASGYESAVKNASLN